MKARPSVSFILFCIILFLIVLAIVPGLFTTSAETPGWYRAVVVLSVPVIVLMTPTALIFGLVYKSEHPGSKMLNRFGLWGSLSVLLFIVGLIVYRVFFYESQGFPRMG